MANRAYLYFCDDISALRFRDHYRRRDGSEREYLDSRHQLPLSWLLFFDPASVLLIREPDKPWRELSLTREWDAAKSDFRRRVPLLKTWFPTLSSRDIETFGSWVESLQSAPAERFLVVDPSELEIDDAHAPQISAALASLDDTALSAEEKYEQSCNWSFQNAPDELDALRNDVFGYFYGPPMPGYYRQSLPWPDVAD